MLAIAAIGAGLSLGVVSAIAAEDVTEDQIVRALAVPKAPPLIRGLSLDRPAEQAAAPPAAPPAEDTFLQSVRGRAPRSFSPAEREQLATMAQAKPNIDLEITFDYNSANISQKSLRSVQALGRALTSPGLKGATFVVAGHTDAAGTDAYNQDLSERRADSIKRYLVEKFHIAGSDLVAVGYGKSKLKDPSRPLAEVNRRVQVVNMASKTAAKQP
ncbi:OmpA family protein [Bradyrhizobium sp. STM 3557]|uniref:OmpA family protein n=1 Tax=Bradyrhizobium sp. STM 3557 TaxID=578920 RepID=UPI00388D6E20